MITKKKQVVYVATWQGGMGRGERENLLLLASWTKSINSLLNKF